MQVSRRRRRDGGGEAEAEVHHISAPFVHTHTRVFDANEPSPKHVTRCDASLAAFAPFVHTHVANTHSLRSCRGTFLFEFREFVEKEATLVMPTLVGVVKDSGVGVSN